MGLFLHKYYQGKTVAANDIGAINYLADIRTIDIMGLGDNDVARLRHTNRRNAENLSRVFYRSDVSIAVVYDSWCSGLLPANWIKKCEWRLANNSVCGSDTVSFYVTKPEYTAEFEKNMKNFTSKLPVSEKVIFYP